MFRVRMRSSGVLKVAFVIFACIIFIIMLYTSREKATTGMKLTIDNLVVQIQQLNQRIANKTISDPIRPLQKVLTNSPARHSLPYEPLNDYVAFPCVSELPPFPDIDRAKTGRCVRTINGSHHVESVVSTQCVNLKTAGGSTPICIHDVKADHYISKSLKTSGSWESDLVTPLYKTLAASPSIEFLDLGCNIGVYSLSAATVGTRVVCVDPLIRNLQLVSRSISLGDLSSKVTLVWNAVSNDYSEVALLVYDGNVGGTAIQNLNETNGVDYRVRTIMLDDLTSMFKGKQIGIKMDVETQELNVLNGGVAFFDEVDVRFIQMEISWHRSRPSGPPIIAFLAARGFLPYTNIHAAVKLDPDNIKQWPGDVYFIKSGQ